MKHLHGSIVSAFVVALGSGIVLRFFPKEGPDMYDFIFKVWNMFWPEIIAFIVFLIAWFVIWTVTFFRTLRKDEEKKFNNLVGEWGNAWHQCVDTFSTHVDDHLKRADRNLKTYRKDYGERLDKLEKALNVKKT